MCEYLCTAINVVLRHECADSAPSVLIRFDKVLTTLLRDNNHC